MKHEPNKMHFANCAALVAVLFTTLIKNLRLFSFAEAGLFLNFKQKWASCSYKIVLIKSVVCLVEDVTIQKASEHNKS